MQTKLGIRLLVVSILLFLLAIFSWVWWNDATSAVDLRDHTSKIFVVGSGESVRTIATHLKNAGLIKDQIGFFLKVKLGNYANKLEAGDFRLNRSMDTQTIIDELTHGTLDVWITTLEGWRDEEIALKLAQTMSIPEKEFLKYAREGYMFPDTYLIPKEATAAAVTSMFASNFEKRVSGDIRNAIEKNGLTFSEGIVLASIVEREGRSDNDRPLIAGILLKRLKNDWPLQADATIQYALGYQGGEKTWWKKVLFDEDKKLDSPYNTYKVRGLPPTPISNPGLSAIRAVANPQDSDYWYYLHDKEGVVHYAKTLEEHNVNVAKYLE